MPEVFSSGVILTDTSFALVWSWLNRIPHTLKSWRSMSWNSVPDSIKSSLVRQNIYSSKDAVITDTIQALLDKTKS
jgi:hypothetical protein